VCVLESVVAPLLFGPESVSPLPTAYHRCHCIGASSTAESITELTADDKLADPHPRSEALEPDLQRSWGGFIGPIAI